MKRFVFFLLLLFPYMLSAQYYAKHYIAPAPWQYWSKSNQLVISTTSETPVTVKVFKSDGTEITDFENTVAPVIVTDLEPISLVFKGDPKALASNKRNETYTDRGIIIEASAPVLVNYRNIDSDVFGVSPITIMGNASLMSFGDEGKGTEFRVGYYRANFDGLSDGTSSTTVTGGQPVYSVMAIEDGTNVMLPTLPPSAVVLNKGEGYLFYAPIGSLVTSDKPIVMNNGSYQDQAQSCGSHRDGTLDQLAPVNQLGRKYMVVRGKGNAVLGTSPSHPEQTLIIATEPNTTVSYINYNDIGVQVGVGSTVTLAAAGDHIGFHHGDKEHLYSSTYIESDKPISVISGTAFDCEVDVSTVLPIGGCSGSTDVRTRKFSIYKKPALTLVDSDYFGYIIIEDETEPVLLNDEDIEVLLGATRKAIGTTGFYLIVFNNDDIDNPENIILQSEKPLTVSLVQQDAGFSMSAFFSAFGQAALAPTVVVENEDCTVTIEAEEGEGILKYEWFKDGVSIGETVENTKIIKSTGGYTVRILRNCGWGNMSMTTFIDVAPCSDLSITKEIGKLGDGMVEFEIAVINLGPVYDEVDVVVDELLPTGYQFMSAVVTAGDYNEMNNQWLIPDLAVGAKEFLTLKVKIIPEGDYNNVVNVWGSNRDLRPENNTASARITNEKFTFTKVAIEKEYHDIDDVIEYSMVLKNIGTNALRNIVIEDVNADKGSVIPNVISNLEPNMEVEIVARHTITEDEYRAGEVVNQAVAVADAVTGTIVMNSDDPSTSKPDDPTVTKLGREADLDAIKDDGLVYYTPGTTIEYKIVVTNNGPTSALDVQVIDLIPEGINVMLWDTNTGESGEGNIEFMVPVIRVGETVEITSSLQIPIDRKGDLINTVSYLSEIYDPKPLCIRCTDIDIENIMIPKGISPNGDGKNDFLDLSRYHVDKLSIYNRYGVLVYEKEKYSREWAGQSSRGNGLPSGTYYYLIRIETGDVLTGWIQLNY